MDVALVLDQVEDRTFDPSQGSAHDGLNADANLGSLSAHDIELNGTRQPVG